MKKFRKFISEKADDDFTHEGWHGTPDARDIEKHGFKTRKQQWGDNDEKPIYWAAKEHRVAKTYANPHRAFDYQNSEPKTLPVKLRIKNPKHIDWKGRTFRGKDGDERYDVKDHIEKARDDGHDGVIVNNIKDTYDTKGKASSIMVVFHHSNIKVKK